MAELEENKVSGVYGGAEFSNTSSSDSESTSSVYSTTSTSSTESTGTTSEFSTTSTSASETISTSTTTSSSTSTSTEVGTIRTTSNSLVKNGFWDKFKAFWLQDIDWNTEIVVELTPYQQKIEDEINAFLHQEITWSKIRRAFSRKKTV